MAIRIDQAVLVSEVPSLATSNLRIDQLALIFEVPVIATSIIYPLTPPSQLQPQDVVLRMVNLIGETVSPFVGSQQEQQWPGQWFELEVSVAPMLRVNYEAVVAFLGALNGKYGTFLFGDHNAKTPQGVATGTPQAAAGNVSGSNQFLTQGWTDSVAGILQAGDYMQVTALNSLGVSMQRLYKVLFTQNSSATGTATFTIFPTLREVPSTGATITLVNTAGTFRLLENATEWRTPRQRTGLISFKAREAL